MPDKTYARLIQTTSMTVSDRRKCKAREKIVKEGGALPPEEPERRPMRAGLRQKLVKVTYTAAQGPLIVDPTKSKMKAEQAAQAQVKVAIPRLKGQEDIPKSDSPEPEDHYASYLSLPIIAGPHTQALPATTSAD
ncbi:hypothetical protein FS749_002855 [Ceratobasidium sp. UAMH 11750]|nr:hypothetical protein FS749_002855 [Ceratobasidium sp. UAMH 11750]